MAIKNFDKPLHSYTSGLMKCIPRLDDDVSFTLEAGYFRKADRLFHCTAATTTGDRNGMAHLHYS